MTSPRFLSRVALVVLAACCASVARPCSVSRQLYAPDALDTFGFYGEVVGHVFMQIPQCEQIPEPGRCAPAWGLRIRIIEPLHVPARKLTEVEYYGFGIAADCGLLPIPQDRVQKRFPLGTRIGLAARLLNWDEPRPARIRLTSLRHPVGEALFILPEDIDPRTLAAARFDYATMMGGPELTLPTEGRARVDFEIWRDTLRLYESRSESDALSILARMGVAVEAVGFISEDANYSAMEQLVDRYLPTPAMRVELLRRLRGPRVENKSN